MELNLMNKQKIDSYFMNLSCEEITYLYETYFKKPKEAINYTPCCVNKDLDKHPIEGVNEFMLTDQEIEGTQFYCNQDDGEYNNNPCYEQCRFCKETEALQ